MYRFSMVLFGVWTVLCVLGFILNLMMLVEQRVPPGQMERAFSNGMTFWATVSVPLLLLAIAGKLPGQQPADAHPKT